jgi:glycosyltransferase involved in cell wall biosynthesis
MRLILFDLGPELRGGQLQTLYLAQAAKAEGIDISIACASGSPLQKNAEEQGIPVLSLPGRRTFSIGNFILLRFELRKTPGTILHTQDAASALQGALLKQFSPAPFFLVHSRRVAYPIRNWLSAWKYTKADAVVAVSREISRMLVSGGMQAEKIRVIHSGIDPALYSRRAEQTDHCFRFGIIGALTPQKGHAVLLDAVACLMRESAPLCRQVPGWQVEIAGDGPLRMEIERRVRAVNARDHVHLRGYVPSRELLPELDALLVASSHGEGSSATLKEAWASGVPVVVSDLPSNLELVRPEVNGLAFISGNGQALAHAMARLMRDAPLRQRLIEGGNESLPSVTHTRMAEENIRLYRELCR